MSALRSDVLGTVPEEQIRQLEGTPIPPRTVSRILDDLVPLFAATWATRNGLERLHRLRAVHRVVRNNRDAISIRRRDRSDAVLLALAEGVAIISLRRALPMFGRVYDNRNLRGGLS